MVGKNISLIFQYFKLNLQKEYQYKTPFFTKILMMILNDAFLILQWLIIFQVTEHIGGYGFKEVMLLWALSAGSYGIAHSLFNGAFNLGNLVYEGKLDVFLTQPKNTLINMVCSEIDVSAIGDIIFMFIALALAGAKWWWYLAAIPLCIVGAIIYASTIVCLQTLSFYVKNGSSLADTINSSITLFGRYPIMIFNTFVKIILFTIIPCGFIMFVPVQFALLSFNMWWIVAMLGFAIVITYLAFLLFRLGLKKYNSGNLMGGRL